jgi:hypothetical protein
MMRFSQYELKVGQWFSPGTLTENQAIHQTIKITELTLS